MAKKYSFEPRGRKLSKADIIWTVVVLLVFAAVLWLYAEPGS